MALKLEKVCFEDILKDISYEFKEGKITSVLSSSGNGKTLLSYLISRIKKPTSGRIISTYENRNLGYVFQNAEESFIFNTVREEIMFGLRKYNYKIDTMEDRVNNSLKMVNLPLNYIDRNPFSLSSGEKELLSLATCLSLNPSLLIIDEPTIYLDNEKKEFLIKLLKKLRDKYHKTIIVFTSDVYFSSKLSDEYVILKNGKIYSSGNASNLLFEKDKLVKAKLEVPKIIDFISLVNKDKKVNLEYTFDVKELMKDIYRNVK